MFLSIDIVRAFAVNRNSELSLAYLLENGELLSIATNSNLLLEPAARELYRNFYDNAFQTCDFFPQYFRFILAIILDLEDLGFKGNVGEQICEHVVKQGFLDYETSDVRRLEVLTLLSRRRPDGTNELKYRDQLRESIDKFISKPDLFVKFNKPLFYALTHFIFFLTNYGTNKIQLKNSPIECLTNVGILAILDDDVDLLAEICICFKFLGKSPPRYWEQYVENSLTEITITFDNNIRSAMNSATDEYHTYFTTNWLLAVRNQPTFIEKFNGGIPCFSLPQKEPSILSLLSDSLYKTQVARTMSMKECVGTLAVLSQRNKALLSDALYATRQTKVLLSKYSGGIFNEKAQTLFSR